MGLDIESRFAPTGGFEAAGLADRLDVRYYHQHSRPAAALRDANEKEMDGFAAQGVELAMADTRPRAVPPDRTHSIILVFRSAATVEPSITEAVFGDTNGKEGPKRKVPASGKP